MQFAEARFPGTAPIDAYGNGGFRFADMSHKGSILCLPDEILAWRPTDPADIGAADFTPVFGAENRPELLLLGTGVSVAPLPEAMGLLFQAECMRVETMGTGAAARTYNVLLSEGRSVGAALIAVQ